jgi:hypothetical protein
MTRSKEEVSMWVAEFLPKDDNEVPSEPSSCCTKHNEAALNSSPATFFSA